MKNTTSTTQSLPSTATLVGILAWAANASRNGCLAIALRAEDETARTSDAAGFDTPLRGITLTKTATEAFSAELGETIFVGDKVVVAIRTADLAAELAAGRGLKGQRYLVGVGVELA